MGKQDRSMGQGGDTGINPGNTNMPGNDYSTTGISTPMRRKPMGGDGGYNGPAMTTNSGLSSSKINSPTMGISPQSNGIAAGDGVFQPINTTKPEEIKPTGDPQQTPGWPGLPPTRDPKLGMRRPVTNWDQARPIRNITYGDGTPATQTMRIPAPQVMYTPPNPMGISSVPQSNNPILIGQQSPDFPGLPPNPNDKSYINSVQRSLPPDISNFGISPQMKRSISQG